MSKENSSIHDFDVKLICEYFSTIERQGPGSTEVTIKALSFIDNLDEHSLIADFGCGTGGQTMTLGQHTTGTITGIDLFPQFIDIFNENANKFGLNHRVQGIVASMENPPFKPNSLDLIWSEGAIYNIGFKKGLQEWRKLLKPNGYIAVTEVSWFTQQRPAEIEDFWNDAYSEINTIPEKILQMEDTGYIPIASFVLPEECWTKNFYEPQVKAQKVFLQKYAGNKTAEELVENEKREAELYQKYKDYYGYVFYIGKRVDK